MFRIGSLVYVSGFGAYKNEQGIVLKYNLGDYWAKLYIFNQEECVNVPVHSIHSKLKVEEKTSSLNHSYIVLNEHISRSNEFASRIKSYLDTGWELSGGIVVDSGIMYQALVKDYENKKMR